jgi:hypothetical protein
MSRPSETIVPLLLTILLAGGCFLGPQPEPPDFNDEANGATADDDETDGDGDMDADADADPGYEPCDPSNRHDDDGDGIWDCGSDWSGEDGGDCDIDGDDPAPPLGGEEQGIPLNELFQWPHDISDDDADADDDDADGDDADGDVADGDVADGDDADGDVVDD